MIQKTALLSVREKKICEKRMMKSNYIVNKHLKFKERIDLGRGLILSMIEYCLESTSVCPRSHLKGIRRTLNRAVRVIVH